MIETDKLSKDALLGRVIDEVAVATASLGAEE